MAHYLTFVFVDHPTDAAVEAALKPFEGDPWDFYYCGGRWDGWLRGPEERERRRNVHRGFGGNAEQNSCRVTELPAGMEPNVYVADNKMIWEMDGEKNFLQSFRAALEKHKDKFVVAVDISV
jgi:hypothetical protein